MKTGAEKRVGGEEKSGESEGAEERRRAERGKEPRREESEKTGYVRSGEVDSNSYLLKVIHLISLEVISFPCFSPYFSTSVLPFS